MMTQIRALSPAMQPMPAPQFGGVQVALSPDKTTLSIATTRNGDVFDGFKVLGKDVTAPDGADKWAGKASKKSFDPTRFDLLKTVTPWLEASGAKAGDKWAAAQLLVHGKRSDAHVFGDNAEAKGSHTYTFTARA